MNPDPTKEPVTAMNPDPTKEPVTARILFTGLMLMCITDDDQLEVGIIQCPKHQPIIIIQKFKGDIPNGPETSISLPGNDLIFKVNMAEVDKVVPHPNPTSDTDFKRVIDLEGPDFHDEGVTVNRARLDGRRLRVTSGKLYTHELSQFELSLLTWMDANDEGTDQNKNLGRTADEVGLNIICRDGEGSGIEILDSKNGVFVALPKLDGEWYRIEVNNDCDRDGQPQPAIDPARKKVGSDFRLYYSVIMGRGPVKFDLKEIVPRELGGAPGICESAYLSQTKTLGFGL